LVEAGAAKAIRVVVVTAYAEFTAIVVAGIAPLIAAGPARIEAVVIGLVGIAAVLAAHVPGQRRAHGAAHDHAGDSGAGAIAATADAVAQQAPDQSAGKNARGIR